MAANLENLSEDQLERLIDDATNKLKGLKVNTAPYWITIELHTGTSAEVASIISHLTKDVLILSYTVAGEFLYLKLRSYQDLNTITAQLQDYKVFMAGPPIENYAIIMQVPSDMTIEDALDLLLKYGSIDQYEVEGNYLYVLFDNEENALKALDDLKDTFYINYEYIEYDVCNSMVVD